MIKEYEKIFAKSGKDKTSLLNHARDVGNTCKKLGEIYGLNPTVCYFIGILHDIGKAHPEFIKRLDSKDFSIPFRHETSSLFFLNLFPKEYHKQIIEGVVSHHKSTIDEVGHKGFIDLYEAYVDDFNLEFHLGDWESWSKNGIDILSELGVEGRIITRAEAIETYHKVFDYVSNIERGYSEYKGVLMGADHLVSALKKDATSFLETKNKTIDFSHYNRESDLYPLSKKDIRSKQPHTIVVSPTGSGKTDLLIKRSKNRLFYVLPFQSSINMMYDRVKKDLAPNNPNIDIRMLHGASKIAFNGGNYVEEILQDKACADIKILTPQQLAGVTLGLKGYEQLILDLRGTDVILDEIHVYNDITRRLIISIVQTLKNIGCKIHIGTATMPTVLLNRIIDILGKDDVLLVKLTESELNTYDRHIIHKINPKERMEFLKKHIDKGDKVLVVFNRVKDAQNFYYEVLTTHKDINVMLIHSRYKRKDRVTLEKLLLSDKFNSSNNPCIVISTQVIEVSLDIDFDAMITDAAPIDSLAQRCGRVNRKRTVEGINSKILKPIYVVEPKQNEYASLPYDLEELNKTFEVLTHGEVLRENSLQKMIDYVYPIIDTRDLGDLSIEKNGVFNFKKLYHKQKSFLIEMLEIDSIVLILESDRNAYINGTRTERSMVEIPVPFKLVKNKKLANVEQLNVGSKPFIIPDSFYSFNINDKSGLKI